MKVKLCDPCVEQIRSIVGANNLTNLDFEPSSESDCQFWCHLKPSKDGIIYQVAPKGISQR